MTQNTNTRHEMIMISQSLIYLPVIVNIPVDCVCPCYDLYKNDLLICMHEKHIHGNILIPQIVYHIIHFHKIRPVFKDSWKWLQWWSINTCYYIHLTVECQPMESWIRSVPVLWQANMVPYFAPYGSASGHICSWLRPITN